MLKEEPGPDHAGPQRSLRRVYISFSSGHGRPSQREVLWVFKHFLATWGERIKGEQEQMLRILVLRLW